MNNFYKQFNNRMTGNPIALVSDGPIFGLAKELFVKGFLN